MSEQLACIYDLVNSPEVILSPEALRDSPITYRAAMNSLLESGYLVEVSTLDPAPDLPSLERSVTGYYPTAEGIEYLYSHRHPTAHWMKKNWFPLSVALINSLIGTAAVAAVLITRKKEPTRRQRR